MPRQVRPVIFLIASCLGGFAFSFWLFFPGMMSGDSLDQYADASSGVFSNWHPPVMAFVWRILGNALGPGPMPMLLLQQLLFWTSIFIISLVLWRRWKSRFSLFLPLIGFLPWILNFAGIIWKDTQMAFSFLAAIALLLLCNTETLQKRHIRLIGVVVAGLIFYGCALRYNGGAAILPILMVGSGVFFGTRGLAKRVTFAVAASLVIIIGAVSFNALITDKKSFIATEVFEFDLAGISYFAKKPVFPEFVIRDKAFSMEKVAENYPKDALSLLFSVTGAPLPLTSDVAEAAEIRNFWASAVWHYKSEFLSHRLLRFKMFLRWNSADGYFAYFWGISENSFGLTWVKNRTVVAVANFIYFFNRSATMKPWFWMIICLLGGIASLTLATPARAPRPSNPVYQTAFYLFLSGTFYLFAYLPIGVPTSDFRYAYWTVIAGTLGALMTLGEFFYQRRASSLR